MGDEQNKDFKKFREPLPPYDDLGRAKIRQRRRGITIREELYVVAALIVAILLVQGSLLHVGAFPLWWQGVLIFLGVYCIIKVRFIQNAELKRLERDERLTSFC